MQRFAPLPSVSHFVEIVTLQVGMRRHDKHVGKILQHVKELLPVRHAELFGTFIEEGDVEREDNQFILADMFKIVGDKSQLVRAETPAVA